MSGMIVPLRRLPQAAGLPLPAYASAHAAGLDLLAAVAEALTLAPGRRAQVPTGIAIALPEGLEAQVRPRSGLAFRHGVTVLNSPGTVDADFRGEIAVVLINLGEEVFRIERGMRIAQLVIAAVERIRWSEVGELPSTERADGGFGSTGMAMLPPDRREG
jgi:dUTP diphosphatase